MSMRPIDSAPAGLLLDCGSVITYSLFEKHRDTEATLGLQTQLFDLRDPDGACRAVMTRLGFDP